MAEQKLLFKRGTKANLELYLVGTAKPAKGEPIYETDSGKFKIGNGINDYKDLPYISGTVAVDGKSIDINSESKIEIKGFETAGSGKFLRKNGTSVEWVDVDVPIEKIILNGSEVAIVNKTVNLGSLASQIALECTTTDYKLTAKLKDANGTVIHTSNVIDLPLEEMIVSGRYDATSKKLILTLKNGQEIEIPIGDLVSGLVSTTQLQQELANYQKKLTAGTGITIDENNVISATGGGSGNVDDVKVNGTSVVKNKVAEIELDEDEFKFKNDLVTMYTIGKYEGTLSNPVPIPIAGKSFREAWDQIFQKEDTEIKVTQPSITISSSNINSYEVGTKLSIAYSTTFNAGSYTYGPATGVTASNYQVKFNGETLTSTSGIFNEIQVIDSTNLKITGTYDHTQGAIPVTNLGNPVPSKQIQAVVGKPMTEKGTLTGYRKMFYGTRTDKTELTSDKIRSLAGNEQQAAKTITVNVVVGAFRTVIAVPSNRTVTSVKDVNASSAEILSAFVESALDVEGANNYSAIQYKIYVLDYAEAIGTANTYKVTIA